MKKIILSFLTILGINFSSKSQTTEVNSKNLDDGLEQILNITSQKFQNKNHAYLINISKNDTVIFQILHGILLEPTRTSTNYFNYSLNLNFDDLPEEEKKFQDLQIAKNFIHYEFDTIQCYAINLGKDKKRTIDYTKLILYKIYGYKSEEEFDFEVWDQGRI